MAEFRKTRNCLLTNVIASGWIIITTKPMSSMLQMFEEMSQVIARFRDHIAWPGLYGEHFEPDKDRWNKFCIAMDTLEDTNLAISAYTKLGLGGTDEGRYLHFYGVLQAVYVQQDTITSLIKLINVKPSSDNDQSSGWKTIREIRNHTAGHPVDRKTFVTRVNLEFGYVSLQTQHPDCIEQWGGALDLLISNYLADAIKILKELYEYVVKAWHKPV
jgi:hypothetical protein